MHLRTSLVAAFAVTSLALSPGPAVKTPTVVEQAYLVQLTAGESLSASSASNHHTSAHEAFHKRATGINYVVRRQFANPGLFYGISIDVVQNDTRAVTEAYLNGIAGVEKVWPVLEYHRTAPKGSSGKSRRQDSASSSAVSSASINSSSSSAVPTPINTLTPPKATGTSDVLSSLEMSGVDKLHALGIKGKGIKIGVIDTGVDYRHPSLGGGFGAGFKIAGGYAYRDDDGNAISSSDPLSTCVEGGHGTHVTGIIGMEDPDDIGFGLSGVAPEAEIYMYRVFGCNSTATTDDILAAMNQAHTDGVDIVSLSLGSIEYWQVSDSFATMTSALAAEGIAVIAAAGNDGQDGLFYPSAPGTGKDVISVGCIENTQFPTVYNTVDSAGTAFSYASVWPLTSTSDGLDVYVLNSTGCDESEWIAASEAVTDKNNTIIVFHYEFTGSDCDLSVREDYWVEYGFSYIMDYVSANTDPYAKQYVLLEQGDSTTHYTNLLPADGLKVAAAYAKAGGYPNYQLAFTDNTVTSVATSTGGMISYFSSFGPTWDTLELKPQLSAPGSTILSTWPLGFNAGYAAIRGTSMATPFVAGSYALVKSQFPDLSVQQIRELLQSTSSPVVSAYYPDLLATAVQQGAGLINPYNAIMSANATTITPTQFEIGDSDDYAGVTLNFTIANSSPESQTFEISHNGAALMYYHAFGVHPFLPGLSLWDTQPESATCASLTFPSDSITVAPGTTEEVTFVVSPPSDFDETKVPLISGFITVTSSLGYTYNLPYEGLPYSRWDAKYIDLGNQTLSATVSVPWPTMWEDDTDDNTFTYYNGSGIMVLDKRAIIIDNLEVGPLINVLQPSKNVRADLLAANTTFVPDHYGYDTSVEWDYVLTEADYRNVMEDGVTPTYGLIGGANPWMPYLGFISWFDLTVTSPNDEWEDDGGVARTEVGDYRVLLSVLKWGGNITNFPADWETWLGPVIRVIDEGLSNGGVPVGTPV